MPKKKDPNIEKMIGKLICPNKDCPGTSKMKQISNHEIIREKKLDGSLHISESCTKCDSSMEHKLIEGKWYSSYTVKGVKRKGRAKYY